jgi:hypothetical protein
MATSSLFRYDESGLPLGLALTTALPGLLLACIPSQSSTSKGSWRCLEGSRRLQISCSHGVLRALAGTNFQTEDPGGYDEADGPVLFCQT